MDLSVVIPAYNECESLAELLQRIRTVADENKWTYEIIIIDDGSSDGSEELLESLKPDYPSLKVIIFRKNYGKSPALSEGFKVAQGRFVVTMDADLQDDPAEIPNLIARLEEGFDLVSGWKQVRHDPISKTLPSKFFNFVTARLTGIHIHDFNCGLKGYRLPVVKSMQVYGEMHRYLPVLAHWNGYRVSEIPVQHHPREFGSSKFGFSRIFSGLFDLLTVLFLTRYKMTPLHVFGFAGLGTFIVGFLIEAYLTFGWLMGNGIAGRPLFFLGILLIIVGIQFFGFGLVAELLLAGMAEKVTYSIRRIID